jgi:putative DNA primase/helicase
VSMLDEALAWARAGTPVFPCNPQPDPPDCEPGRRRAKSPLVPGPEKDAKGEKIPKTGGLWRATTDERQIRSWWRKTPDALIGMPTGRRAGVFVVDLDPHGESAAETEARLIAAVGPLPPGPRAVTQSGGLHLYFRLPEGEADLPKNSAKRLDNIDWRGDGGYVIVPPSRMRNGAEYRWVISPEEQGYPEPPARLLDLVYQRGAFARVAAARNPAPTSPAGERPTPAPMRRGGDPGDRQALAYARAVLDRAAADVAGAGQGGRGHTLNAAAFGVAPYVALGILSEREAFAALADAADSCGLTATDGPAERDAKIRRGLDAGRGNTASAGANIERVRSEAREKAEAWERRQGNRPPPVAGPADYGLPEAPLAAADPFEDADFGEDLGDDAAAWDEPAAPPPGSVDREAVAECAGLDHSDTDNGRRLVRHFGADLRVVRRIGPRNTDYVAWTGSHWDLDTGNDAAFAAAQRMGGLILLEADHLEATPPERRAIEDGGQAGRDLALLEKREADWTDEDKATARRLKAAVDAGKTARAALDKRKVARRKFGISSKNKARLEAMLACAAPHITMPLDGFNADPYRVATLGHTLRFRRVRDDECPDPEVVRWRGVVEVTAGHRREDMITALVPVGYDPAARAPGFVAFTQRFLPDASVRRFVQVYSGLSLLGLTIQKFVFHYGEGANGKSVYMQTLYNVFGGGLGVNLPAESLSGPNQRQGQQASPDLARLYGKRYLRVQELAEGVSLQEELIKRLTGGEEITARALFQGMADFKPVFKAQMSGNGYPKIEGTNHGIWRRIAVVHWPVKIPEAEQLNFDDVVDGFRDEYPGVLNWLIEGALIYLAEGLVVPEAVRHATQEFRDEMDPVGDFLAQCVIVHADAAAAAMAKVTAREMYEAYDGWAWANSVRPITETKFGRVMKTRIPRSEGRIREYLGCSLHLERPRRPAAPSGGRDAYG